MSISSFLLLLADRTWV